MIEKVVVDIVYSELLKHFDESLMGDREQIRDQQIYEAKSKSDSFKRKINERPRRKRKRKK